MNDSAYVHLNVSAEKKGRWVRASRSAGMKLTEWITMAVESHLSRSIAALSIPDDIQFSDLGLSIESNGDLSFEWDVIARICAHNSFPVELLIDGPGENVAAMIVAWHSAHVANGGLADPVATSMSREVEMEDEHGGGFSHQPGRS